MPGSYILKAIEAHLTHKTDLLTRMDPYCVFETSAGKIQGSVSQKGGKNPCWNDVVTIPNIGQSNVLVQIMEKDTFTRDDVVGTCVIDLNEVQMTGRVSRWYPLNYKNKLAGEILMECIFQPTTSSLGGQSCGYYPQQQQMAGVINSGGFIPTTQPPGTIGIPPTTYPQQSMAGGIATGGFIPTTQPLGPIGIPPTTYPQQQPMAGGIATGGFIATTQPLGTMGIPPPTYPQQQQQMVGITNTGFIPTSQPFGTMGMQPTTYPQQQMAGGITTGGFIPTTQPFGTLGMQPTTYHQQQQHQMAGGITNAGFVPTTQQLGPMGIQPTTFTGTPGQQYNQTLPTGTYGLQNMARF